MKRELMRRHILETCIDLFSAATADSQTMDEIARSCSITKPTLYTYFRNKEAILFALFNQIADQFLERMNGLLVVYKGDRKNWAYFETVFDEIMVFVQSKRQILMLLIRETHRVGSGDDIDDHLKSWLAKREEVMSLFEKLIRPMIPDDKLKRFGGRVIAISVFQIFCGILTEYFFSAHLDLAQYRSFLKELLQNGIFNKEV